MNSHFGVVDIAATDHAAVWAVFCWVLAFPLVAVQTLPTVGARAGPVDGVASPAVDATTLMFAIQTIPTVGTLLLTLKRNIEK